MNSYRHDWYPREIRRVQIAIQGIHSVQTVIQGNHTVAHNLLHENLIFGPI